jgi:hypothetical protein
MALCYSITEAGFLGLHPVWFMLVVMVVRFQPVALCEPYPIQQPLATSAEWKTLSL